MLLMRLIIFYQRHFSKHTCMYSPTCSEYMLRVLNNHGVIIGLGLGSKKRGHRSEKRAEWLVQIKAGLGYFLVIWGT